MSILKFKKHSYQEGGYLDIITDHDSIYDYAIGKNGSYYAKKKGDGLFNIDLTDNKVAENRLISHLKNKISNNKAVEFGLKDNDKAIYKIESDGKLHLKRIGQGKDWIPITNPKEETRILSLVNNETVHPIISINQYRAKHNMKPLDVPKEEVVLPKKPIVTNGGSGYNSKTKPAFNNNPVRIETSMLNSLSKNIKETGKNLNQKLTTFSNALQEKLNEGIETISNLPDLIKNKYQRSQASDNTNIEREEQLAESKPVYKFKNSKSPITKQGEIKTITWKGLPRTVQETDINTNTASFNYRNRGDYSEKTNTEGLYIPTFHPFISNNDFNAQYKPKGDEGVIGIDEKTGKTFFGKYSELPQGHNFKLSKTYHNEYYGHPKINGNIKTTVDKDNYDKVSPQYYASSDSTKTGKINILALNQDKIHSMGEITGGQIAVKNPFTGETKIIKGSVKTVSEKLEQMLQDVKKQSKGKINKLDLITLDNGSYATGYVPTQGKTITSDALKKYDKFNTSGGSGLTLNELPDYGQGTVYKSDTLSTNNVLLPNSEIALKYKQKGLPLTNIPKSIVLHHTGTNPNATTNDIVNIFNNQGNSAHAVIEQNGKRTIFKNSNFKDNNDQILYHAGEGRYITSKGDTLNNLNSNSLGIEIIGNTTNKGAKRFTDNQVKSTSEYIVPNMLKHNIPITDVTTHDITALSRDHNHKFDIHLIDHKNILRNVLKELAEINAWESLPGFDKKQINNSQYVENYLDKITKEQITRTHGTNFNQNQKKVLQATGRVFKKGGIHIKPENKGKFNATKKRTGKTTEELTHSKNPVTKKRAVFSQNAKKWKHSKGGLFMYQTTIKQG
jgi:N-acetyl-anhydromuramyl-L-alanine amidase AmpD